MKKWHQCLGAKERISVLIILLEPVIFIVPAMLFLAVFGYWLAKLIYGPENGFTVEKAVVTFLGVSLLSAFPTAMNFWKYHRNARKSQDELTIRNGNTEDTSGDGTTPPLD